MIYIILIFLATVILNIPLFVGMLFTSFVALIAYIQGISGTFIPIRLYHGVSSIVFTAIPFFILTGLVMEKSKLSQILIDFSAIFVGKIRGGLAIVNVVSSMFFAGMTGAASADTASVGAVLIPGMIKKGYDADFSVAITITSSTIGVIIPPSIPMIVYAGMVSVSVGQLFLAGLIPGIIIGLALILVSYLISLKHNYPTEKPVKLNREFLRRFLLGLPPFLIILIIFGGIFSGIFTPTEASIVAAAYSILLGFLFGSLSIKDLGSLLIETAAMTSVVTMLIAASNLFSWILSVQQIPAKLRDIILLNTDSTVEVLLIIILTYLIIGCFIDLTPAMVILVPIFWPLVQVTNINPIHFGIVTIMALAIGLYTPPVGVCLAVGLSIAGEKVTIGTVVRSLIPFFLIMVFTLLLVTIFPQISLFMTKYFS